MEYGIKNRKLIKNYAFYANLEIFKNSLFVIIKSKIRLFSIAVKK